MYHGEGIRSRTGNVRDNLQLVLHFFIASTEKVRRCVFWQLKDVQLASSKGLSLREELVRAEHVYIIYAEKRGK